MQKDKKGNVIDTFGMNDEDWAIYKKVSKDPNFDDDEEGYYAKLAEIDKELQKLDPSKNSLLSMKIKKTLRK